MAKSFHKSRRNFYKLLKFLSLIAVILAGIIPTLEFINGFSSSGDTYENIYGGFVKDNEGNVNITGDIYNYYEKEVKIEVKNKINNIYNIIETQETSKADDTDVDVEPQPTEEYYDNSIGMEFVEIPSGEFMMGSPYDEMYRERDEGPVHKVTIEYPFYLGKFEVTQEQWGKVMGNNPSNFKGEDLPVDNVSWNDAQEFIRKLNEIEDTDKYRLPSEAEWEYACRAGSTTKYSFGNDESKLEDYAWYLSNSEGETHPVGQKKPNPWGLYDIYGNVWEWVQDTHHSDYSSAPSDGSAWTSGGNSHVARGSSFKRPSSGKSPDVAGCRSANRGGGNDTKLEDKGLRLLMEI